MSEETTARRRPSPSRPRPKATDGQQDDPTGEPTAAAQPREWRPTQWQPTEWRPPESGAPDTTRIAGPRHAAVVGRPGVQNLLDGNAPAEPEANGNRSVNGASRDGANPPRWQRLFRRGDQDDDEGPFFPPETGRPAAAPASERPRPRPRPGPGSGEAADSGLRPPDISRYLNKPDPGAAATTEDRHSDTDKGNEAPADGSRPQPATEAETESSDKRSRWRERLAATRNSRTATRLGLTLAIVVVSAIVLRVFVVAPYFVPSASMEPTLHGCAGCSDDHILVDKISYRFHGPQPGDIVVFSRPKDDPSLPDENLVKRVVATGGDHVALRGGILYVNGGRLDESYLDKSCGAHASRPHTGRSRWTVPHDDVFVMGDNRCDSTDSRDFGPIPNSSIQGRAFLIFWPLSRFGLL